MQLYQVVSVSYSRTEQHRATRSQSIQASVAQVVVDGLTSLLSPFTSASSWAHRWHVRIGWSGGGQRVGANHNKFGLQEGFLIITNNLYIYSFIIIYLYITLLIYCINKFIYLSLHLFSESI